MGYNPVVLNMAAATKPGGGVKSGAGAQEETIFRRSTYFKKYYHDSHTSMEGGIVYTPGVFVFREGLDHGYALMDNPFEMAFVASAASRLSHPGDMDVEIRARTLAKAEALLEMANAKGHDAIILSAFGCGAFRNPPDVIAQVFQEAILKRGAGLKKVVFGIMEDHNSGGRNVAAFADAFGS